MKPTIRLDVGTEGNGKHHNRVHQCFTEQRRQQTLIRNIQARTCVVKSETVQAYSVLHVLTVLVCCICEIHFIRKKSLPVFCRHWGFNYTNLPQVLIIFTFFNLPGLDYSAAVRTETRSFGDGRTTAYNSKLVWSRVHNANTLWQAHWQRTDCLMRIVVALVAVSWLC